MRPMIAILCTYILALIASGCHHSNDAALSQAMADVEAAKSELAQANARADAAEAELAKLKLNPPPQRGPAVSQGGSEKDQALAIIKQLGGKVEEDLNRVDRPIVGVSLVGAPLSDDGLSQLTKSLPELRSLELGNNKITDAGLAHLKGLTKLESLQTGGGGITDAGLMRIGELTSLKKLGIVAFTPITDAGLAHLKGLSQLEELNVSYIGVTDEGLVHLQGLANLKNLCLNATKVTDAGLAHLKNLKSLHTLWLGGTKVTEPATKELQRSLPSLATIHR